jgi:hypothetical protein
MVCAQETKPFHTEKGEKTGESAGVHHFILKA